MLEWKSFTAYNIEVLVQSPQRELMVLFKVLLISCPPRCTFSPPSWTGSQAHITEYSETSLRVFLSQQMQLHQQTRQPGKPHYFIHSFLDQIDKVQGPAALNSSPAAHQQAPGTQQHLSSVPTGTENPESHFQAEMLVMTTHNLFFGGRDHRHHPALWTPHSAQIRRGVMSASWRARDEGAGVWGQLEAAVGTVHISGSPRQSAG